MNFKTLLATHKGDIALVVGNGVNQYRLARATNSWSDLLLALANRFFTRLHSTVPPGIALTEFYDLLEIQSEKSTRDGSLQQGFCNQMKGWRPHEHHRRIVVWAQKNNAPMLTTNFDNVLGEAGGCSLHRTERDGFTDFYPWECYYGNTHTSDPTAQFGIWHINGMQYYWRSIRLGLTHYMGSVGRAREWIHKHEETRLFTGKNVENWKGAKTWLHIVFNKPLVFFGLGLQENEVFLRWLLIERAKYFRNFPIRKKLAWYVHVSDSESKGKLFFLEGVGVTPVKVRSYDEIYGSDAWE